LEKPTEGRGVGAFLKGTFLGGLFSGMIMTIVKIFVAAFVSIVITMILFVRPGILVNAPAR